MQQEICENDWPTVRLSGKHLSPLLDLLKYLQKEVKISSKKKKKKKKKKKEQTPEWQYMK